MRVINSSEKLSFASDQECVDRRQELINTGVILPANLLNIKGNAARENERERLIELGFINPNLCELIPDNKSTKTPEEGEYCLRPITSEEEYLRRKQIYFRMMQEILFARIDLGLILAKKRDSDPDWYF